MILERRLILDGIDLYNAFRCFTAENGGQSLVQFPKAKNITTTEWHETDGVSADLTDPLPDSRTVSIDIYAHNKIDTQTLVAWLASFSPYHTLKYRDLPGELKLRLQSVSSVSVLEDQMAKISLQFIEDDVTTWYTMSRAYSDSFIEELRQASQQTNYYLRRPYRQPNYAIDGIVLSDIGLNVLKGTDQSIYKTAKVNDNLKTTIETYRGTVFYDTHSVRFKNRDITLKMLAHTDNPSRLRTVMMQLYGILARPGKRQLWFGKLNRSFDCYYKQASVSRLYVSHENEAWCEFSVALATLHDTPQAAHTVPYGRAYSSGFSIAYL